MKNGKRHAMTKIARKGSGTAYTELQNRPQPVTHKSKGLTHKEKPVRRNY